MPLESDADTGDKRCDTWTFRPGVGEGGVSLNEKERVGLDPGGRPLEGAGVNPPLGKGSQWQGLQKQLLGGSLKG